MISYDLYSYLFCGCSTRPRSRDFLARSLSPYFFSTVSIDLLTLSKQSFSRAGRSAFCAYVLYINEPVLSSGVLPVMSQINYLQKTPFGVVGSGELLLRLKASRAPRWAPVLQRESSSGDRPPSRVTLLSSRATTRVKYLFCMTRRRLLEAKYLRVPKTEAKPELVQDLTLEITHLVFDEIKYHYPDGSGFTLSFDTTSLQYKTKDSYTKVSTSFACPLNLMEN